MEKKNKKVKINWEEAVASLIVDRSHGSRVYFMRDVFEDGCVLAFWSDSPWGRLHDQDRGWVIIQPQGEDKKEGIIVDELETYYFGSLNSDYRNWLKEQKVKHGRVVRRFQRKDPLTGRLVYIWKMHE